MLTLGTTSSLSKISVSLAKVLDKDRRSPDELLGRLGAVVVGVTKHMATRIMNVNSISE